MYQRKTKLKLNNRQKSHSSTQSRPIKCARRQLYRTENPLSFSIRSGGCGSDFSRFSSVLPHREGFEGAFGFLGDRRERKTEPHGVHRLALSLSRSRHLFVFHIDRVLIQLCTVSPLYLTPYRAESLLTLVEHHPRR